MLNLAISGARGRMGQAIEKLAFNDPEITVTALLEHKDHPEAGQAVNGVDINTDNNCLEGCDVLIEFTLPEGTINNLKACVKHGVKMVIGTTGLSEAQIEEIHKAAEKIPIVFASNMSIGVNVLFKLIEIAASKIQPNNIGIQETHHIHKKDKPSGTAKTMGEIAEEHSGIKLGHIQSFREGEVIGDHSITFDSTEDVLMISHHAKDRSMFAKGALTAAKWLQDKNKGLYNMQNVLELN